MSAATRLRRLMEDAEIVVLEKGPFFHLPIVDYPTMYLEKLKREKVY